MINNQWDFFLFLSQAQEYPKQPLYEEDGEEECGDNFEITETDENWYKCWGPDDPNDELGTEYVEEG